jgi:hypothetical protein
VDFLSLDTACLSLLSHLRVRVAGFDPWQTTLFTQKYQSEGYDVREMSMSITEQFRRAWLWKQLLYQQGITKLPNETGDREEKNLQRKGATNRIDHPEKPGHSKDIYDARSIAAWLAATAHCNELTILNLNPDSGAEAGRRER